MRTSAEIPPPTFHTFSHSNLWKTHSHDPVSVLIVSKSPFTKQIREVASDALGQPGVRPGLYCDEAAKKLLSHGGGHQLSWGHGLVYYVLWVKQVNADNGKKILIM